MLQFAVYKVIKELLKPKRGQSITSGITWSKYKLYMCTQVGCQLSQIFSGTENQPMTGGYTIQNFYKVCDWLFYSWYY